MLTTFLLDKSAERRQKMAYNSDTMKKLVTICKQRGIIFPSSEIYGGLANTWDYGPLGFEIKNNIKKLWFKNFVQEVPENVPIDTAILMNPKTWMASGHVGGFSDPLMDCRICKTRYRADKLIEEWCKKNGDGDVVVDGWSDVEMMDFINENGISCPVCGKKDFTDIRQFNLMFKTFQGVTEDSMHELYLRPETAQGIFVNFNNVLRATRRKLPIGIGQIGKSFRNEITPGNFIFRVREFEQCELEFFCNPSDDLMWFDFWKKHVKDWLLRLGMKDELLRMRDHSEDELSFYSKCTTDVEFKFPFGWGELWGIADRTDYDLKQHMEYSGEDFTYRDPYTGEKFVPYCVEPSVSLERLVLAFLCSAYEEEVLETGKNRTVLKLHPELAPYKACVLPLSKKLDENARKIYYDLLSSFSVDYDDSGSIGKRYRRQDEIGTPYCITVDFESETDGEVTVRNRDTMMQTRVKINDLNHFLSERIHI